MSNRDLNMEEADYEDLEHMTTGLSKIKKIHLTIHYLIWVAAPILSVDLVRLAKTGKWFNPFYYITLISVIPVKIGDGVYAVFTKIPVVGKPLSLFFCAPFYIWLPMKRAGGFTWREFTEAGVEKAKEKAPSPGKKVKKAGRKRAKKAGRQAGRKAQSKLEGRIETQAAKQAAKQGEERGSKMIAKKMPKIFEKLFVKFWDDLISIPAAATVIGGIALTIIDIPFSTGTYNLMELWGHDKKWVKAGGVRRWLVTAFLPKKYNEDGEVIEDLRKNRGGSEGFNSSSTNSQVMADGGRDDRREFRDLNANNTNDNSGISLSGLPAGKIAKASGALIGVFALLIGGVAVVGGSGYGSLVNDMFGAPATEAGNAAEDATGAAGSGLGQLINSISCIAPSAIGGGGAGCARELSLNQSRQPGSEDVGETYRVEVSNLEVSGSKDVRFRLPDSKIPVSFMAENTRRGTKGIPARDVRYRVKVTAPGLAKDQVTCRTGWKPLNKYGSNYEGPSEENNLILPGGSVRPLNYQGENRLSFKQCGLMNPVAGGSFRAKVQLKYDYSALSFLRLNAEAYNPSDTIEEKRSKTPNTPVETVIRAENPITYYNEDNPRPFPVRVRITADQSSFKVDSSEFTLKDSSLTEHISGQCDGLENVGGNEFTFDDSITDRIQSRQEELGGWFSEKTGTPTARCNFELSNPESISETGESLTFTAEANYTVRTEPKSTSFTIRDTSCSTQNCPYIVPVDSNELKENFVVGIDLEEDKWIDYETQNWEREDYWKKEYAMCNRPYDAEDGCSYIESFMPDDRVNPLGTVNHGDMAVDMTGTYTGKNFVTCYAKDNAEEGVTGLKPDNIEKAFSSTNSAFNYTGGDWQFITEYKPGC